MEYKKDIYRRVCSSDWISTTLYEVKFRDFIHDIICMLFDKDDINIEQCRMLKLMVIQYNCIGSKYNSAIMKEHFYRSCARLVDNGITIISRR